MIPVFDLDQVRIAWVEIRGAGFVLYGFMLYSDQDTVLVEFMHHQSGLAEVDQLSGPECAIFVIESPSRKWIEYAKHHKHPWWSILGNRIPQFADEDVPATGETNSRISQTVETLLRHQTTVMISVGDDQPVSLRHLIEPDYASLYDRTEIWNVVRHFGLKPQEIPCIVFFRDIDQGEIDVVCLRDIRSARQATLSLRDFFGGGDFERLLIEARNHA
jgi:hypothetical protein